PLAELRRAASAFIVPCLEHGVRCFCLNLFQSLDANTGRQVLPGCKVQKLAPHPQHEGLLGHQVRAFWPNRILRASSASLEFSVSGVPRRSSPAFLPFSKPGRTRHWPNHRFSAGKSSRFCPWLL